MIDDPYAILKGWIAYAEERPYDRDAQELRKLSEAAIEKMMPLRDMKDLGGEAIEESRRIIDEGGRPKKGRFRL